MESPDCNRFNKLLLKLSNELRDDQLNSLKFLCSSFMGKGILEKINTGYNLFEKLMQHRKLSPGDTDFLCDSLTDVGRQDLANELKNFNHGGAAAFQSQPSDAETGNPWVVLVVRSVVVVCGLLCAVTSQSVPRSSSPRRQVSPLRPDIIFILIFLFYACYACYLFQLKEKTWKRITE